MDKKVYEKPLVIEYENLKDITAGMSISGNPS